jgi:hypothetical protein
VEVAVLHRADDPARGHDLVGRIDHEPHGTPRRDRGRDPAPGIEPGRIERHARIEAVAVPPEDAVLGEDHLGALVEQRGDRAGHRRVGRGLQGHQHDVDRADRGRIVARLDRHGEGLVGHLEGQAGALDGGQMLAPGKDGDIAAGPRQVRGEEAADRAGAVDQDSQGLQASVTSKRERMAGSRVMPRPGPIAEAKAAGLHHSGGCQMGEERVGLGVHLDEIDIAARGGKLGTGIEPDRPAIHVQGHLLAPTLAHGDEAPAHGDPGRLGDVGLRPVGVDLVQKHAKARLAVAVLAHRQRRPARHTVPLPIGCGVVDRKGLFQPVEPGGLKRVHDGQEALGRLALARIHHQLPVAGGGTAAGRCSAPAAASAGSLTLKRVWPLAAMASIISGRSIGRLVA